MEFLRESKVPKKYPKLSIVTPSFNQAEFIEATIQSVLSQEYENLEYIIIDGGSTDGSQAIIEKYEKRLAFWCSEPDAGQYDAINKGFSKSTGEIMAWINSDDMYFPWTFRTIASVMSELPAVNWLTTLMPGAWDSAGFCSGFSNIAGYSKDSFLHGCYVPFRMHGVGFIQQESTFWRRSVWDKAGSALDTNYQLAADFDLWSKFFLHENLYGLCSPLAGFRCQENQRSRQVELYLKEVEVSLQNMRESCNWRSPSWKTRPSRLKLQRIPKLHNVFDSFLGFRGQKIVRDHPKSRQSSWKIVEHNFYYS